MDRATDVQRSERAIAGCGARHRCESELALDEVPVRAALMQGKRSEREASRHVTRGRGKRLEREEVGQLGSIGRRHVVERERELVDRHHRRLARLLAGVDAVRAVDLHADHAVRAHRLQHLPRRHAREVEPERLRQPADRRLVRRAGIDASRDDQTLAGAGHRDVDEAASLRELGGHLVFAEQAPQRWRDERAGRRRDAEREAAVGGREQVGHLEVGVASSVRERDDVELEALRRVHGHDPYGVDLLLGEHGLGLLCGKLGERVDERQEAREVRAAQRLVVARQAHELAHVRVAPAPIALREAREVVVVLRDDPLEQIGDPDSLRCLDEPVEALPEGLHQPRVVVGQPIREPVLEPAEERGLGRAPERVQPGVGDADERRREHGQQRAVVVPAAQETQVRAQVRDLLAAVVAAADRAVRVEARLAERRLVQLRIGARAQEHDHPRLLVALVAQLGETRGQRDRLVLARVPDLARLVDDQQLERDPVGWGRSAPAREQPLEPVVEHAAEDLVQHRDEGIGRAEAVVQPDDRPCLGAPPAEHLDIRVAEAVDALPLVADVAALGIRTGDQLQDRVLQRVGVLELVDEQVPDTVLHRRSCVGIADEEIARAQLEICEVERRARELPGGVGPIEALDEPDDLRMQDAYELDRAPRPPVRRAAPGRPQGPQVRS